MAATSIRYLQAHETRIVQEHSMHIIKADLAASDAAAGVLDLQNNTGRDLMVARMWIRTTTVATGACTLDVGVADTEISNDTIFDAVDVHTATGIQDSITNSGTDTAVPAGVIWKAGSFLTASMVGGATAGLVGKAYVEVFPIP